MSCKICELNLQLGFIYKLSPERLECTACHQDHRFWSFLAVYLGRVADNHHFESTRGLRCRNCGINLDPVAIKCESSGFYWQVADLVLADVVNCIMTISWLE